MARKAHYVLSTHWDREWYQTFQDYRYRLVQLLDRVLDGWQREDLCGPFQTDGQAILLEDYLEVRPEREEQVRQLVQDGRFIVGPWYVLPDEFLVSGESIVRNLQFGRQAARRLGGQPSNAGFLCDMFGHNSQMPQILSGFGIRGAFLWRGINLIDQRLFRWRGADGTELPAYRFGRIGYCSYAAQVRAARPGEPRPTEEAYEQRLQAFLDEENIKTKTGPLLLFDGGDHMEWDEPAYAVLAQHFENPSPAYEILHSSLDAYLDDLLPEAGAIAPVFQGELREPGIYPAEVDEQWLIPGVTSSRVWIKQANAACQSLLTQWAEPVSAFASVTLGLPYPQGFLDAAWKWLLQNHPHDSICGCSIDAVHQDMVFRFHQCEGIANRLLVEASRRIAASAAGDLPEDALRMAVFNPLARPLQGVVDLDLEIPVGWPVFSEMMGDFEALPNFRIFHSSGSEIPYQRTGQSQNRKRFRTLDTVFPQSYRVNVVRVSLPLSLPALGYTTLLVRPVASSTPVRLHPPSASAPVSFPVSDHAMENEHLRVQFAVDGTLAVTDKRSGQTYQNLLVFEDCADIGDGWNFAPAVNDHALYSSVGQASRALVHSGPYKTTFRLRTVMDLPEAFDFSSMVRSTATRKLTIDSLVTLRAGADWVEVETTVQNNVQDHRLRVLFPSGASSAQTCLMDTPFDVVERPIHLRGYNAFVREVEVETRPQQSFTAVFEPGRGLAVVTSGLMEAAVQDLPERPVALTLFRATRRTVFTDGEPGGQVQGEQRFRYWIVPLNGDPDCANLIELGQALAGGIHAAQLTPADAQRFRQPPDLPASASFLRVDRPAVLTSLRSSEAGLEARLFNPTAGEVESVLDFSGWPGTCPLPDAVQPVDFEGGPLGEPYPVMDARVAIPFGPKQIRTLRLIHTEQ